FVLPGAALGQRAGAPVHAAVPRQQLGHRRRDHLEARRGGRDVEVGELCAATAGKLHVTRPENSDHAVTVTGCRTTASNRYPKVLCRATSGWVLPRTSVARASNCVEPMVRGCQSSSHRCQPVAGPTGRARRHVPPPSVLTSTFRIGPCAD